MGKELTDKDIEKIIKEREEEAKRSEIFWNTQATNLTGKVIKKARYMTKKEAEDWMWGYRPLVIFFTDGSHLIVSCDDEGNDGGSLIGKDENGNQMDFPVLRDY